MTESTEPTRVEILAKLAEVEQLRKMLARYKLNDAEQIKVRDEINAELASLPGRLKAFI